MSQMFTLSYSASYGDTPQKLMENVILPFLDGLAAHQEKTFSLRIVGRKGRLTGIKVEIDEAWDGLSERLQRAR